MSASAAEIAGRLNLHRLARSWRGTCPACGYASAFSVRAGRDGAAEMFCASCRDRDGINRAVQLVIGGQWAPPARAAMQDEAEIRERKREAAGRLWNGSVPVAGTLAERYLEVRGIGHIATSSALRFRIDTPHPEGGKLPALIAIVRDVTGRPIGVHRTYLRADGGGKADVEPAKASLGPIWGGAIRLHPAAGEMVVGEGLETAASAGRLMDLPAWAGVSAGNLAKALALPPAVQKAVIAGDPDLAGRRAADDAARRWRADGKTVRIALPDRAAGDFNDMLLAGHGHE